MSIKIIPKHFFGVLLLAASLAGYGQGSTTPVLIDVNLSQNQRNLPRKGDFSGMMKPIIPT